MTRKSKEKILINLLRKYEVRFLEDKKKKREFDQLCDDISFRKDGFHIKNLLEDHVYLAVLNKENNKIVAGCKMARSWAKNTFLNDILDKNSKINKPINMTKYVKPKEKFVEFSRLFSDIANEPFLLLKYKIHEYFVQNDIDYGIVLTKEPVLRMVSQSRLGLVQRINKKEEPFIFKIAENIKYHLCKIIPSYRVVKWAMRDGS